MTRLGYQIPNFTYPDTPPDQLFERVRGLDRDQGLGHDFGRVCALGIPPRGDHAAQQIAIGDDAHRLLL